MNKVFKWYIKQLIPYLSRNAIKEKVKAKSVLILVCAIS